VIEGESTASAKQEFALANDTHPARVRHLFAAYDLARDHRQGERCLVRH